MKCANCDSPALFIYEITPEVSIKYCNNHLPRFLEARKKAGTLKTTEEWQKGLDEISKTLGVRAPAIEESAPIKKKTVKKTAK